MTKTFPILFTFLLFACKSNTQDLTKEQASQDLAELKSELENFHAGYSRYTPIDSMDLLFSHIETNLTAMSVMDFYKEITLIASKIRCGHTRASLPESSGAKFQRNNLFLPFTISINNGRVYVRKSLDSALKPGDEIHSINDIETPKILEEIFKHQSSDGFVTSGKTQMTSYFFHYYFQLYHTKGSTSYRVNLGNSSVRVSGKNWSDLETIQSFSRPGAIMELQHEKDYSYLRIGSFGESSLRSNGYNYTQFLAETFKDLKERGTKNLILDLRGNGGGKDSFGALLVSYLVNDDFGYFEKIEVTDQYSGYGEVVRSENTNLMTSHSGLSIQSSQKDNFQGSLYLLADGWTFSTAADVVSVLDNLNRAYIVGEETGGGRFGNTSGASKTVTLPNSQIRVNIPMWKYTTALRDEIDAGRGVIPNAQISPTIQEVLQGVDVQINYCLDLISEN
ncbi:MAG: S41 family peptidase [Cyclobacteriaceae bacterium]